MLYQFVALPIPPDDPARVALLDFRGLESFVLTVVPLPHLFRDDVMRQLREMIKKQMERPVGANPGRDEDGADVLGINDF